MEDAVGMGRGHRRDVHEAQHLLERQREQLLPAGGRGQAGDAAALPHLAHVGEVGEPTIGGSGKGADEGVDLDEAVGADGRGEQVHGGFAGAAAAVAGEDVEHVVQRAHAVVEPLADGIGRDLVERLQLLLHRLQAVGGVAVLERQLEIGAAEAAGSHRSQRLAVAQHRDQIGALVDERARARLAEKRLEGALGIAAVELEHEIVGERRLVGVLLHLLRELHRFLPIDLARRKRRSLGKIAMNVENGKGAHGRWPRKEEET
jgi:hypothetical protein